MLWPARSAIPPVPSHAVVPRSALERVEAELTEGDDLDAKLAGRLEALEQQQPALAEYLKSALDGVVDDTARALGEFLGVAIAEAFREAFGGRAGAVDAATVQSARETFDYDEELRRGAADELLETDDVVAIGQPHLVSFVREQLDAALEPDGVAASEVDLDAVAVVYRSLLIEILALGQAVEPPRRLNRLVGLA